MKKKSLPTRYFKHEGRQNLARCIPHALEACAIFKAHSLVVFTATGHGVYAALAAKAANPTYSKVRIIAVTFPTDYVKSPSLVNDDPTRKTFESLDVPVISSALPFGATGSDPAEDAVRGVPKRVLSMFGGGLALCVQAIAVARDAGALLPGELVVAATADTAILARAASSAKLFDVAEGLVVDRVLCKPMSYRVSRPAQFGGEVAVAGEAGVGGQAGAGAPALGPALVREVPARDGKVDEAVPKRKPESNR